MTAAVCALLAWGLFSYGSQAGSQVTHAPDKDRGTSASVTLSTAHPMGSFPVGAETLAVAPPILALRIAKVVNPDKTPFGISVYLSYQLGGREKISVERKRILIGEFGIFPTDRPAGFLLRASHAFDELAAAGSNLKPNKVRLLVEMKRLRDNKPPGQIKVTIASPEWRDEAQK